MNKKKWRAKFAGRDSPRFLKRYPPYYSDKYRTGGMPPADQWMDTVKAIWKGYADDKREYQAMLDEAAFRRRSEDAIAWLDTTALGRRIKAVEQARRESSQNGWPEGSFEFLRSVAWHYGIHYNHAGNNYKGKYKNRFRRHKADIINRKNARKEQKHERS